MLLNKIKYITSLLLFSSLLFTNISTRDCPDNFVLNPEYPTNNPECYPSEFLFNTSSQQAFYYFNFITIDGIDIESEDWVGAFKNDICIGSRQWDISQCNGNVCDIPIMGYDGEEYSLGYIENGEIPTFKIYDYSENIYYDATPSSEEAWYDLDFIFIDNLATITSVLGCTDILACNYDSEADFDDDSCWFPTDGCSCDYPQFSIIDECGVCNGPGILDGFCDCNGNILDECGLCGGPGAVFDCGCQNIEEGTCDCDGNILDECGICDGSGLNIDGCCGDDIADCLGECNGLAEFDECGICDSDINNDCIQDCDGIWGGNAEYDNCGVCDSDVNNNCIQDCNGIWGGTSNLDECGVCNGDNSTCNSPTASNQNIEINEDVAIDFIIDAIDPNNNQLELIVLSNPIHGLLNIIQDLNVRYVPNSNYSGEDYIFYKVTNGEWESNTAQIIITINELFDPPIILDINISTLEDESLIIDLGAYDIDTNDDELVFNIFSYPNFGSLTEQRATASYLYTPNIDYYGLDSFIYEVSDGINSSQGEVFINILNINDAPTALDFNFTDMQTINFSDFINDIDQDNLLIKTIPPSTSDNLMTVFGNQLVYSGSEYIYNYSTSNNEFDILLYKVSDGLSESYVATAIYDDTNSSFNRDIPIALSDEIIMEEDNQIQISFFAFDYDAFLNGNPLINIEYNPNFGILEELSEPIISGVVAEWTALYTPFENYFGTDQISFSIIDDDGEISDQNGIISILINPINDMPILSNILDVEIDEDDIYTIDLLAIDVDGDDLIFSISESINIINNLSEGILQLTPMADWNGLETLTVSVSDGLLQDSQVITVIVNPINDAPVLVTNLNNIIFEEDSNIFVDIFAYDVEGDILNYIISDGGNNNNISASINYNPLSIEFAAPENWNGTEVFSLSVNDGLLLDYTEVIVTVEPINDPPLILSSSPSEFEVNIGYLYNIEAVDFDNDNLFYTISGAPEGMSINENLISWNMIPNNISHEEFLISVSDGLITVYENVDLTIIQFYDCNGIINGPATLDCSGVCQGIAIIDNCGVCEGDNSTCSGCTNFNACNYDYTAIIDNGTCEYPAVPYDCNDECINDTDFDGICDELEIVGCTNPESPNYNIFATDDDGSCINPECIQDFDLSTFDYHDFEFNGSITTAVLINDLPNGSINDLLIGFVDDEIRGYSYGMIFPITGETQFPIMLYSNQSSGEIITFKYYHSSSNQLFCLSETIEFISDMIIGNGLNPFIFNIQEQYILGCTDQTACNYNPESNFDNGSCSYPEDYYDCSGICINDNDNDNICDEIDICDGLVNVDIDNDGVCNDIDPCIGYDNIDDDDDGICNDFDPCIGYDNIDDDDDGICNDQEIIGCLDIEACNYESNATDAGDCFYDVDCAGLCGGDSYLDVCNECVPAGTNPGDCLSSDINIPDALYLSQNYPNPFNPISMIEYGIPENSYVDISLYDLNGRKLNTMVNSLHRSGYYKLTLSSENLNSGIYLIKIKSGNMVQTRKITIIK